MSKPEVIEVLQRIPITSNLGVIALINENYAASQILPELETSGVVDAIASDQLCVVTGHVAEAKKLIPVLTAINEHPGVNRAEQTWVISSERKRL